jgi:hypothetical protein
MKFKNQLIQRKLSHVQEYIKIMQCDTTQVGGSRFGSSSPWQGIAASEQCLAPGYFLRRHASSDYISVTVISASPRVSPFRMLCQVKSRTMEKLISWEPLKGNLNSKLAQLGKKWAVHREP